MSAVVRIDPWRGAAPTGVVLMAPQAGLRWHRARGHILRQRDTEGDFHQNEDPARLGDC